MFVTESNRYKSGYKKTVSTEGIEVSKRVQLGSIFINSLFMRKHHIWKLQKIIHKNKFFDEKTYL